MNFRTQVELPKKETNLSHSDQIVLWGSCFAENIGKLLVENKFRCDVNPFGILYNPMSIAQAFRQVLSEKKYDKTDLFYAGEAWHSWMHHSAFSDSSVDACLARINGRIEHLAASLPKTNWVFVTWGTAFVYHLKGTEQVVGNCHKQPEKMFSRRRMKVNEIVMDWKQLIQELRRVNPELKVLLTVSPVRHAKDGMHGNQVSKATLLLAADELCAECDGCYYFPSYEIIMDELRDYRFYSDDMLHLSNKAVEYVWECFCQCYFDEETLWIMEKWKEIKKGLDHRPFHPESATYRAFLSQIVLKIARLKEKFPYLEVQKEIELCESRLKI